MTTDRNVIHRFGGRWFARACACLLIVVALAALSALVAGQTPQRTFATPDEAVQALVDATKAGSLDGLVAIFGPDSQELVSSGDPAAARMNQQTFNVAVKEKKQLVDAGPNRKTLVIGNEEWPFPVPLVKDARGWRFDTAAGKEEIIARRIGRNELAAIETCLAYVTAQMRYAQKAHDDKPAGVYAAKFQSDPGKQNGLYWPSVKGQPLSPLGDLVAQASEEGVRVNADRSQPSPLHGYYFKILTSQGAAARGGAKNYIVNGNMSGGFALVAWPAQYDVTGVMTFIVGADGVVRQKDLGPNTDTTARSMAAFNPDSSWKAAE